MCCQCHKHFDVSRTCLSDFLDKCMDGLGLAELAFSMQITQERISEWVSHRGLNPLWLLP